MHFVIFNLNNCFQFSGTFELCVTFCSCSGVLALVGKVDFTVMHLSSGTASFPSTWSFSSSQPCIGSGARQVKKHLYWWLLSSFKFCFYLVDFDQHEQQAINILKIILYFSSVQHIPQVLQQRRHGPCVLPSQNMLLLLLPSLDLFFSLYVNLANL